MWQLPVLPGHLYCVDLHMRIRSRIRVAYRLEFVRRVRFVCLVEIWSGLIFWYVDLAGGGGVFCVRSGGGLCGVTGFL